MKLSMHRAVIGVVMVVAGASAACVPPPMEMGMPTPDAPPPPPPRPPEGPPGNLPISLTGAMGQLQWNAGFAKKVLKSGDTLAVSPNLVMAAAQSSQGEPATVGPKGQPGTPSPDNAAGHSVVHPDGAAVLAALQQAGVRTMAPFVTTSRDPSTKKSTTTSVNDEGEKQYVSTTSSSSRTWVERLMAAHSQTGTSPSIMVRTTELPKYALAVDLLGIETGAAKFDVVLSPQGIQVLPVGDEEIQSNCALPPVVLSRVRIKLELFDLRSGEIVARRDVSTLPQVTAPLDLMVNAPVPSAEQPIQTPSSLCDGIQAGLADYSDANQLAARAAPRKLVEDEAKKLIAELVE